MDALGCADNARIAAYISQLPAGLARSKLERIVGDWKAGKVKAPTNYLLKVFKEELDKHIALNGPRNDTEARSHSSSPDANGNGTGNFDPHAHHGENNPAPGSSGNVTVAVGGAGSSTAAGSTGARDVSPSYPRGSQGLPVRCEGAFEAEWERLRMALRAAAGAPSESGEPARVPLGRLLDNGLTFPAGASGGSTGDGVNRAGRGAGADGSRQRWDGSGAAGLASNGGGPPAGGRGGEGGNAGTGHKHRSFELVVHDDVVMMKKVADDSYNRFTGRYGCDVFVRVTVFSPKTSTGAAAQASVDRVSSLCHRGFTLLGRRYEFLCFKDKDRKKLSWKNNKPADDEDAGLGLPSEVLSGRSRYMLLFVCAGACRPPTTLEEIYNWHFPLRENPRKPVAECNYRFSLGLSDTKPILPPRWPTWSMEDDVTHDGQVYTDGCGRASPAVMREIGRQTDVQNPVAVQIRYGPFKGMLIVDHQLEKEKKQVVFSKSMCKYELPHPTDEQCMLEVLKIDTNREAGRTSGQAIQLLEHHGLKVSTLLALAHEQLEKAKEIMTDIDAAEVAACTEHGPWAQIAKRLLLAKIPLHEYYLQRSLAELVQLRSQGITCRANIPLERSAYCRMLPDWSGVLEAGEVFVVCCDHVLDPDVDGQHIVAVRSPCVQPSDVVSFRLRRPASLVETFVTGRSALPTNIILFSTKQSPTGPPAVLLSNGDMDGDRCLVIFEKRIVNEVLPSLERFPRGEAAAAAVAGPTWKPPEASDACPRRLVGELASSFADFHREFVEDFLVRFREGNSLGLCIYFHEALVDRFGFDHRDVVMLASMCGPLLDGPKKGLPAPTPGDIQKHGAEKVPDFMLLRDKKKKKQKQRSAAQRGRFQQKLYKSDKALGALFRLWSDKMLASNVIEDRAREGPLLPLVVAGHQEFLGEAYETLERYLAKASRAIHQQQNGRRQWTKSSTPSARSARGADPRGRAGQGGGTQKAPGGLDERRIGAEDEEEEGDEELEDEQVEDPTQEDTVRAVTQEAVAFLRTWAESLGQRKDAFISALYVQSCSARVPPSGGDSSETSESSETAPGPSRLRYRAGSAGGGGGPWGAGDAGGGGGHYSTMARSLPWEAFFEDLTRVYVSNNGQGGGQGGGRIVYADPSCVDRINRLRSEA
eukprot:jgi/Mesvir1/27477/Mv07252-RA.1